MAKDEMDELKKLSPQDRLKKLKEIEDRNKKEIQEAQKLMKQSEAELEEEEKTKKQLPLPQLRSIDDSNLFGKGTQEDDMLATKQFKQIRRGKKEEELEEQVEEKGGALENTVSREREWLKEEHEQAAMYTASMPQRQQRYQSNLTRELSEGTARDIYKMISEVYSEAKESGYVSSEQMSRINAASEAALSKLDAMVSGDYQASKQATDALVASARMAKAMKDLYKA